LCPETYAIRVTNNKDVGGINATDAAGVNYWSAHFGSIEHVKFLTGDVTNNYDIIPQDVSKIQRYYVFDELFARSEWSYWKQGEFILSNDNPFEAGNPDKPWPTDIKVTVNGNVSGFDPYAMCTGDLNGSLVPDPLK
jgi:hypothetical protein